VADGVFDGVESEQPAAWRRRVSVARGSIASGQSCSKTPSTSGVKKWRGPGSSIACCGDRDGQRCRHAAKFVGSRPKSIASRFGEDVRKAWLDMWRHRLKHERGRATPTALESLDLADASPADREHHRKQLTYLRNHCHRMDYPTYLAKCWQIGGGPVESACRTVSGNRLKGGGTPRGEAASDGIAHRRAV
jgi:hypothetical protein